MCSMYFSLQADFTCPLCGAEVEGWQEPLQTHFMGKVGSCSNYYGIGVTIPELENVTVILDGTNDSFCGQCPECDEFIDFGARIELGAVREIWALEAGWDKTLVEDQMRANGSVWTDLT